jgi:F-type H+-transporting ATPase subunit delta
MAELSQIARPYAKAVFELAREQGDYRPWSALLEKLASLVRDPQLRSLLNHPRVTRAALTEALNKGLGGLDGRSANLVRLLVENGRLACAAEMAAQFEALRAEAERTVEVGITSAVELPEAQRKALVDAIGKRLSRAVQVQWSVDAELIAGAVIRAGDTVIDGSAQGELRRLQTALSQ